MAPLYTPSRKRQREAALCCPGSSSLPRDLLSISSQDCSPLRESMFLACWLLCRGLHEAFFLVK